MARKRWQAQTEITPALLKFREKRKWQIALRRYVLERNPCVFYAPYFGLDIENLRNWFESQFTASQTWEDFGKKWQFNHIIPVTYFDFSNETDLKLCWNFTNLRVETLDNSKDAGNWIDILRAKAYFKELHHKTGYQPCADLLDKIDRIELSENVSIDSQQAFLLKKNDYLKHIEGYTSFEFELLNRGRSLEEVTKEIEFLKKYSG